MILEKYTHILWDWNGTLFNDAWLCVDVMNHVLAKRHLPLMTVERYRAILRFPIQGYYQELGFDFTAEPFEQLGAEFMKEYEARRQECGLYPGVKDALARVRDAGKRQSILSAYPQDTLTELVGTFGIQGFFDDIIGLDNIYATSKVEQGRVWMAARGYTRSEVLMIGDTIHDFEVADAIGADCILVAAGHNSKSRLQACPVPIVDSLHEIFSVR